MKISREVMTVLSRAEVNGTRVALKEQLDRKLYLETNKVLSALGGVWDRKAAAHVFPWDATERIEEVLLTGNYESARDTGNFPTPWGIAKMLVELAYVQKDDRVLEPSAGTGRIVGCMLEAGARVEACERDVFRRRELIQKYPSAHVWALDDFCDALPFSVFDRVVMNPPFCKSGAGDHLDHVRLAFDMLKAGGRLVAVLPNSITFRQDRRHAKFREWFENRKVYIESLPEAAFAESGTNVRTVALVLDKV